MKRRQYLTAVTGALSAFMSGCTFISNDVTLDSPRKESQAGNLRFIHEYDGTDILTVSLMQQVEGPTIRRLDIELDHPENTSLDSFRFRFQPNTQFIDHQPAGFLVYLLPPSNEDGMVEFHEEGQWTVVESFGDFDASQFEGDFDVLLFGRGGVEELAPLRLAYGVVSSENEYLGDTYSAHHETSTELDELLDG